MRRIYLSKKLPINFKNALPFSDWCLENKEFFDYFKKKKKIKYFSNINNHLKNKKKEYTVVKKYIQFIFNNIYKILNEYHHVNFNKKYWKIILFPWLNIYLPFIYIKWKQVNTKKFDKKNVFYSFKYNDQDFIIDSLEKFKFDEDENLFYLNKALEYKKFKLNKIKKKKIIRQKKTLKNIFYLLPWKVYYVCFKNLYKKKNIFFINSNFKKIDLIHYYLRNLKIPFIFKNLDYKKNPTNIDVRKKLFKNVYIGKNNFLKFFFSNLYLIIPKSYLEDFKNLRQLIKKYYPINENNKFLTAFEYKKNDIFKFWVAENSLLRGKYFIIQHGGAFGIDQINNEEDYIKQISDKFLTWGWKDSNKCFSFYHQRLKIRNNFIKTNSVNKNQKKKILIIFHHFNRFVTRISSQPNTNLERLRKIYNLSRICSNLEDKFEITVRYRSTNEKTWDSAIDKKLFSKKTKFDDGKENLEKVIFNYDLIIQDANSTTFLETCYFNVPSILVLDKEIQKSRKSFSFFKKNFIKKNIFFYNHEDLVNFVRSKNNFRLWWNSQGIQNLLKKFCKLYINSIQDKNSIINKIA